MPFTLETSDLEFNDVAGCWVKCYEQTTRRKCGFINFCVPQNRVQYLTQYCDTLKKADLYIGRLFKPYGRRKSDGSCYYTAQPMGATISAKTDVHVAEFIGLENSRSFTSHSFERSAATNMEETGASSTDMKVHFS